MVVVRVGGGRRGCPSFHSNMNSPPISFSKIDNKTEIEKTEREEEEEEEPRMGMGGVRGGLSDVQTAKASSNTRHQ